MNNIILCPGQGAQAIGMCKLWCEVSEAARAIFEQADELLGDSLGAPLSQLCLEGPAETLNRTDVSQPAIYTASLACFAGWLDGENLTAKELNMVATAGLSLGEYTALHLAGAFSFADGLKLVALRGKTMQEAAQAVDSSMVALIGADEESANAVCDKARESDILVAANFNAPGQVVISGSASACDRAEVIAGEMKLRATRLSVAGAFHSPIMAPAADRLSEALGATQIDGLHCTVMSNVTAKPHEQDSDSIRMRLVEQLTSPVRWSACCEHLIASHSDHADTQFHELAPGKSLGGMMRRIDRGTKVQGHNEPEKQDACMIEAVSYMLNAQCLCCEKYGMMLAFKLPDGSLTVQCHECELGYTSPLDAINQEKNWTRDFDTPPTLATMQDIQSYGWDKYEWEPTQYDPFHIDPVVENLINSHKKSTLSRWWQRFTNKRT